MGLTIHQALHGYSDGHRLISGSLPLLSTDARIMLVMSDLSGPGVKPEPSGYLTGYPLEGAGKYVLARTWAALEMPRPGCVWTHSLLIDNADLASMTSADNLVSAFRRPASNVAKSEYAEPAVIATTPSLAATILPDDRARRIINALYMAPEHTIVAGVEQAQEDEQLIAAIWMQQWPRLRRRFGFCTLAGTDRSEKGVPLDLQLVRSLDRQVRAKFPGALIPSEIAPEPVLEPLTADLEGRDKTQLREFLRRTGGDVDGGRRAMLPLCRLHLSFFAKHQPDLAAAVSALSSLDSLGTRQARSVRMMVARRAIEEVEGVDDAVFDFVVESLEQSARANEQPLPADRIGLGLWRRSPVRFAEAIDRGGAMGQASERALATISAQDLVMGLRDHPLLAARIAGARPDLLANVDFWSSPSVSDDLAAAVEPAEAGRVAVALLASGRVRPAPVIIKRAEPGELASALNSSAVSSVLRAWLDALIQDAGKAAAVLASGRITNRSIVVALARAGHPDLIPNDYGEDPWLIAIRAAAKPVRQADEEYLSAFAMARALGPQSRSQAQLISFAYTTLHRAFQRSRLPEEVGRMVTWRLDSGGWFNWDNCSRLRDTVVNRFIDLHLDPAAFGHLTSDVDLAKSLFDEAARTGRGRRYLEDVQKRLKKGADKESRARAAYIAKKIG